MALQSTIGSSNDVYVTKTAFYWSVGIIILLLAAISASMARDITRLSLTRDSSVVSERLPAAPIESELPPPPPQEENARSAAETDRLKNQAVEAGNPQAPAGAGNTR